MDVVIGRTPPPGPVGDRNSEPSTQLEARVLHVRPGRRRIDPHRGNRRAAQPTDPPGARVIVLLVPDGQRIPEDVASGRWRVLLRFAKR